KLQSRKPHLLKQRFLLLPQSAFPPLHPAKAAGKSRRSPTRCSSGCAPPARVGVRGQECGTLGIRITNVEVWREPALSECRCSKIMSPLNCNQTLSPYRD